MTQRIDEARLARELRTVRYGRSLDYRDETESTNDDARAALERGVSAGHVVMADAQTRGRGSRGRVWESPPGTDLYVSIVDRVQVAVADLPPLTLAVGLGIADAVDEVLTGRELPPSQVKWPNDVWLAGKKCAGVLIETSVSGSASDGVVIGIGLNVNREQFPDELASTATSLRAVHPEHGELDRTRVLRILLGHVERRVDSFVAQGPAVIVAELKPRLLYVGKRVACGDQRGVLRGIAPSGALQIETAQGLRSCVVGPLELID